MIVANALDYLKAIFLEIAKVLRDFQTLTTAALSCDKQP